MTYLYHTSSFLQRLFFFMAFLLMTSSAFAQNSHLRGRITTPQGEPAAFVSVLLKELQKTTLTSEEGSFYFRNVPAGTYTLQATCVGFTPMEQQVTVSYDKTVTHDLLLEKSNQRLGEVTVTGRQTLNEKPLSIGKVPIKPLDLPQSVTIIGSEVLERQQTQVLSEVLQNVNGVYLMGTTGGTQEEIGGRGFAFGSNNTFKNGARFNNGVMPEMSSLERVEVMKGSNAILFGNVAAGGVLNLVTKKPRFESGGEVSMRVGSYDYYKPSLDVYGAINNSEKVAYRLNTTYLNAGSFRDGVTSERFYINPSLLVKAGAKTDVLLEGDYLKDTRTPDFGVGAINYTIANVPRSRYLGVSFGENNVEQKSATATITHRLHPNWEIRSTNSFQNYDARQITSTRPTGFIKSKKDGTFNGDLARGLQQTASNEKYYLSQFDITGKFKTGSIEHTLLVGADADKYDTQSPSYITLAAFDTINIYQPEKYEPRRSIPSLGRRTYDTKNVTRRIGVYVQDFLSLSEKWKVLAGLRYSAIDIEGEGNTVVKGADTRTTTSSYDYAFSPRAGIVFQPTPNMSLFASYANSFTPNTGTDIYFRPLDPSIIDQYEVGMKNELFKGLLSANLTLYQIKNSASPQTALFDAEGKPNANTTIRELAGEITSKGVEVDLMSKSINGWSFLGGYSYNDTRYTKSNIFQKNDRLRYNPAHTANASVYYTFQNTHLRGLNLGVSSFYAGDRLAGRNTRLTVPNDAFRLIALPNYVLFDAHVGYSLQRLSLRLKMTNLLDKLTYNAHDDNSINPIAPRQFMATLSYKL
ncbi:TonB-dependent siderophore receptor [Rufibacter glacialis]|uniref:TonB-dependent receptor n=1 Tax=Rufibacter glacialis TaxID=1259555 RepID=A0A5M8QEQ5_9BACT|nr:TonB-dependent receptor [Rufibacter glacialis]KAA6434489.1 TonB-dependent receptor [Rufibacter glacialis]GGK70092.1 TonB-dependent receptor [Rufibacter glacialis]